MITLGKLKELYIAKQRFRFLIEIDNFIDYNSWIKYIDDNCKIFTWYEDTKEGHDILSKIDIIPHEFKDSFTSSLNKVKCFMEYNKKKQYYDISVGCDGKRVAIIFERTPKIEELKLFLNMAKHLDAMLLYRGKINIDEKIIEELANNKKVQNKRKE